MFNIMIIFLIFLIIPPTFFNSNPTADQKALDSFEYNKIISKAKTNFKNNKKDMDAVYSFNHIYQYNDQNDRSIKNAKFLVDEYPVDRYYKYLFAPMAYQSKLFLHTDYSFSNIFTSNTNKIQLDMNYELSKSHDFWTMGFESSSKNYKSNSVKLLDQQFNVGKRIFINHKWNFLLQGFAGSNDEIFSKYAVYSEVNYLRNVVNYSVGYKLNQYNDKRTHIVNLGADIPYGSWAYNVREYFNMDEEQNLLYVTKFQVEYAYDYQKSIKGGVAYGDEAVDTNLYAKFKEFNLDLNYRVDPRVTIKPGIAIHSNDYYNETKIGVDFIWNY